MSKLTHYVFLFIVVIVAATIGCRGNVQSRGTVKFDDGSPLSEGVIYFSTAQNEYFSALKSDGTFSIWAVREGDGLPPGQYLVYVTFPSILDPKDWPVDKKFTVPETSGWTADVQPGGKNRFEFVVTRPAKN